MWGKVSLGLHGKETNSGPAGSVMNHEGLEASGLTRYCKHYSEAITSTSLLITNLQHAANGNGSTKSYIDVLIYINGRLVGVNYSTVENSTGNFGVSASVTEILQEGTSSFSLCVRNSNTTAPTVNFSVSLVQ